MNQFMDLNKVAAIIVANTVSFVLTDEEDEELLDHEDILIAQCNRELRAHIRISNYLENVVNLYSEVEFKMHFRMNRATFEFVLNLIGPKLQKKVNDDRHQGRNPIDPKKQLLILIWTLATPDSYRSVSDRFDVGKATCLRTVRRVMKALLNYKSDFIKWPTYEEANESIAAFQNSYGFPGVLGYVDGTHIKIAAPKENSEDYINRKQYHSIQLQLTCDYTRKIIHCYVGLPGSTHDQRVFRNSGLDEICNNDEYFSNNSHLLGDAAYTIHPHLLVPYRDNGRLTNTQKNFNRRLSSARMTIERTNALLKGRFRIFLDRLDVKRTDLIPYYVMTGCILHNICLKLNDHFQALIIIGNDEQVVIGNNRNNFNREGLIKRDYIANNLPIE